MPDTPAIKLTLGPTQANVIISALTDYCISISDPHEADQRIAENLRDMIARKVRRTGRQSRW